MASRQPPARVVAAIRRRRQAMAAAGRATKPRARIPQQRWPNGARMSYQLKLSKLVAKAHELVTDHWLRLVPGLLEQVKSERKGLTLDAAADGVAGLDVDVLLGEIDRAFRAKAIARGAVDDVAAHNKGELNRQFQAGLGVDLLQDEPKLAAQLDLFAAENVKLIEGLSRDMLDKIRAVIVRGVRESAPLARIRSDIQDQVGVSKRRAAFIARDQVGSVNAELTKMRHEAVGVDEYTWRTAGDARVRRGHQDLEGSRQRYDKPPITDRKTGRRANPGQDPNCRCVAEPALEKLRVAAEAA